MPERWSPADSPEVRAWKDAITLGANRYLDRERRLSAFLNEGKVILKYEIHVDAQPDPAGGWSREFRVELHFDDNPEFVAFDRTLGGRIMHTTFNDNDLSIWSTEQINSHVWTQLALDYPQLRPVMAAAQRALVIVDKPPPPEYAG